MWSQVQAAGTCARAWGRSSSSARPQRRLRTDDLFSYAHDSERHAVKITEANVIVTSPSRNFVTLKITTDDGVTGLGDATLNGRELAVAAYLTEHVAPLLLGLDPHRIEDTWQFLYRSAYWRRGPVTMAA